MPLPPVPTVKKASEPIIASTRELLHERQTGQLADPHLTRRPQPDLACAISSNVELPSFVNGVQPAANILERCAKSGERSRLKVDVAKFYRPGADCLDQMAFLPVDAGIADGTFGIVPDCQLWRHLRLRQECERSREKALPERTIRDCANVSAAKNWIAIERDPAIKPILHAAGQDRKGAQKMPRSA